MAFTSQKEHHRISTKMVSPPRYTPGSTSVAPSCKASQEHHIISSCLAPPLKLNDLNIEQKQLHLLTSTRYSILRMSTNTINKTTTDCQSTIYSFFKKKGRSSAILSRNRGVPCVAGNRQAQRLPPSCPPNRRRNCIRRRKTHTAPKINNPRHKELTKNKDSITN
jgi:hypothetical protein